MRFKGLAESELQLHVFVVTNERQNSITQPIPADVIILTVR